MTVTSRSASAATSGIVLGSVVVHATGRQRSRRRSIALHPPVLVVPRERIIRIREVLHRVPVNRATIYKWMNEGRFPRQVALGANSAGWYESEVDAWIADPTGWRPPNTS